MTTKYYMKPFVGEFNPRHPNYKPRGMKRFHYTYKDIAAALNRSVQTIKNLNATGKLDPHSLKSIIDNYVSRQ